MTKMKIVYDSSYLSDQKPGNKSSKPTDFSSSLFIAHKTIKCNNHANHAKDANHDNSEVQENYQVTQPREKTSTTSYDIDIRHRVAASSGKIRRKFTIVEG